MINPLFESSCFKVMTLFSISPGSRFNRTEIQQKTRLNNVTLDKALQRLVNSKVIGKNNRLYFFNFENESTKLVLQLAKQQYLYLKELPLSVYYQIGDLVEYFSVLKKVEIILFGSYAKLVHKEKSDIDLAVIYSGKLDTKKINVWAAKLSQSYGRLLEIHYFEKKSFYQHRKDQLIKSILKDGVKLV
jgi:predicted nucleotidyltransferase